MKDMLHYDPNRRPTAQQCLQHKFFQVQVPIPINAPDVIDLEASQLLEELDLSIDNTSFGI
jgi:hypothetical protein